MQYGRVNYFKFHNGVKVNLISLLLSFISIENLFFVIYCWFYEIMGRTTINLKDLLFSK